MSRAAAPPSRFPTPFAAALQAAINTMRAIPDEETEGKTLGVLLDARARLQRNVRLTHQLLTRQAKRALWIGIGFTVAGLVTLLGYTFWRVSTQGGFVVGETDLIILLFASTPLPVIVGWAWGYSLRQKMGGLSEEEAVQAATVRFDVATVKRFVNFG